MAISAVTALVVFAAGALMFPASKPPAPTVAVAPPPPPPPAPAPPPVAADSGTGGGTTVGDAAAETPEISAATDEKAPRIALAEADAREPAEGDAEPAAKKSKRRKDKDRDKQKDKEKDKEGASGKSSRGTPDSGASSDAAEKKEDNRPLPPSDGTAPAPAPESSKDKESDAHCALAEKDMAREAWHRNRPTVCPVPSSGKAFILIPIKGPIAGESHELRRKREAWVILPAGAESQLTMKQYKLKKLGFKELWVSNDESGARLRVKLQPGAGDPVFEVKDGYAKITVATP
jgi:hypothetical protein